MSIENDGEVDKEVTDAPEEPHDGADVKDNNDGRPAGYDPVDFEKATPQEIATRMRYVYRQAKDAQEQNTKLKGTIKEMERKLEKISGDIGVQGVDREISHLESQRKEARAAGDDDRVDQISDKIADLRAEKRLSQRNIKPDNNQEEPEVNHELERDRGYVNLWASELTEAGNYVRPWAQPGHPQFKRATDMLNLISTDQRFSHYTLDEKLMILEREMKAKPSGQGTQTVLTGGNRPTARKGDDDRLSDNEKDVARKMFRGTKYKSDEDRFKAYAKAKRSA